MRLEKEERKDEERIVGTSEIDIIHQILLVNIKPAQERTRKREAEKMRLGEEERKQEG